MALQPLPSCPGPKLHPFQLPTPNDRSIAFISVIAEVSHAIVCEAQIGGRTYAIKCVR